mgnify:CR=1 FL=1
MNEAELIIAWGEVSGHLWTVIQFWASISFGVIAIAHFAPEKLNLFLVLFVIFLYTLFSLYCASLFVEDAQLMMSLYEEASLLLVQRGEDAIFLSAFINYQPIMAIPFTFIGFPAVFIGSISYLVYRYHGTRSDARNRAS